MNEFRAFEKIPRLYREIIITEKIDGTNAQINISDQGDIQCGSRNKFITPQDDNYGFAKWVESNKDEVLKLGPGQHFGEWWGNGIQRNYNTAQKRFTLFNCGRWTALNVPSCISVVPILYTGDFSDEAIKETLQLLRDKGSMAAPGYMEPEGIVVFHKASGHLYKVMLENDEKAKNEQ